MLQTAPILDAIRFRIWSKNDPGWYMDHPKWCINRQSQFGIYGGYALPHMIISQPELMTLAHVLDWLLAMTIFTFCPSIIYRIQPTPFKLPAHPLLNSDHMTDIPHSCVDRDIQICWPRQYLNLGWLIIFKSRPGLAGLLLLGKCTAILDCFKRG